MSTVSYFNIATGNSRSLVIAWSAMANGDDGQPMPHSAYTDKSVQVSGTFGVGGSLRLEGSNNGTDWAPLSDPQGGSLDIVSAKIKQVVEATRFIRPRVTGGDGTTSLAVHLYVKE
jgi:hypothetical protein